jgi:uncharacterized protein (TIGR03437 family)
VVALGQNGLPGLSVPGSVTVPANATTASFSVSTGALSSDQNGTVTASYGGASQSVNISLAAGAAVLSSLQCNPTTLGANASATCSVSLSKAAGSGGAVVAVGQNGLPGLSVPGSVTVPANATTASFTITTGALSSNQNGTVTAYYGSTSQSVYISLSGAITISSFQCNPTTFSSGGRSTCSVTLSAIVPADAAIGLSTTVAGLALPRAATVPAGSSTNSFQILATNVADTVSGTLTASYNGSSQSIQITLQPAPAVSSIQVSCESSSLSGGDSTSCSVEVARKAPTGGSIITLTTGSGRLRIPGSVVVAEGALSATFPVQSEVSDRDETASIRASLADATGRKGIFLRGVRPGSLTCAPRTLVAGQRGRCELQLNSAPTSGGLEIAVSSDGEDLKLPSALRTRPHQSSLAFEVMADPAARQQDVRIEARYGESVAQTDLSLLAAGAPVLTAPAREIAKFAQVVRFAVKASDAGGPVSPAASGLPSGASWDPATGVFEWTPAEFQQGNHEVVFTATNSSHLASSRRVRIEVDGGQPVISALVNAATGARDGACSPGAIASLRGKWLSSGAPVADLSGSSMELAGTRVKVNGSAATILYADPTRVDFLCPQIAAGTALEARVETDAGTSNGAETVMQQLSPGIFSLDGSGQGQGLVALGGSPVLAAVRAFGNAGQPAQADDFISVRVTGLGSMDELSRVKPWVKIGGLPVQAAAVDAVAGIAGMYDVSVKLPANVPSGREVPLSLELPGRDSASNTVSISIEPVRP